MKKRIALGAIAACLFTVSVNAQEPSWNDAQTEVWALVEQSWVDDVAENGKWPTDYIHDNYVSWGDGDAAPRYKDSAIAWNRFGDESSNTLMYEVSPEAIAIVDGTAVVHYNVTTVTEDSKGERNASVGRITEVLVRVGRSWKWIAGVDYEPKLND
ncbi:MAG: hypothetical protein WBM61_03700 [Woeseiaceae bacterium]|jgi:hypothetical protein